jgi:hypothetical protein
VKRGDDAAVGDSILFKPDLSLAHVAERLRASFRSRTRGLRFFASSQEQKRTMQVRSASDHQTIPSTSGERASLAQCAPQHEARLRERYAASLRLPLHTIQFTANKTIAKCGLRIADLGKRSFAFSNPHSEIRNPQFGWSSSQERLQSQCQKS